MSFEEFEKAILEKGGSFEDVGRLNKEGYYSAVDCFGETWEPGFEEYLFIAESDYQDALYGCGRLFVLENLGDIFHLSNERTIETE